jgi:hypothetical protein
MKIATIKDLDNLFKKYPSIRMEITKACDNKFFVVIKKDHNNLTLQHADGKTLKEAFKNINKNAIEMSAQY